MNNEKHNKVLLSVNNLSKSFKVKAGMFNQQKKFLKAVDNVSFNIYAGETLGLVGESGCGKTTIGRTILNLYQPDAGCINFFLNGKIYNILNSGSRQKKTIQKNIQAIFQDPWSSLNPRLLIKDIIAEGPREFKTHNKKTLNSWLSELFAKTNLPIEAKNRYPHEFSGGQRQRISIARALASNPSLIICDEPVSALDVSVQAQILNLLIMLQEKYRLTYLFIAHDLSVVQFISDRIAVMYLGRIVELATRDAIINKAKHPYTCSLIASIPIADPDFKLQNDTINGEIPDPIHLPSGCAFHPRCSRKKRICAFEKPVYKETAKNHFIACHLY